MPIIKFVLVSPGVIQFITDDVKKHKELFNSMLVSTFRPDQYGKMRQQFIPTISIIGKFKTGLFFEVYKHAIRIFGTENIVIDLKIQEHIRPILEIKNSDQLVQLPNQDFKYFQDQEEAIKRCLKFGRGVIISPCASGKSAMIAGLLHNLQFNHCLIIVPTRQLVTQFFQDFKKYGIHDACEFSSGTGKYANKKIIVSNKQWLQLHSNELPKIDMLIVDECDVISSRNKINKYINSLSTPRRFGFTATEPKEKERLYEMLGTIGPIIYKMMYSELKLQREVIEVQINSIHFHLGLKSNEVKDIYDNPQIKPSQRYSAEVSMFLNDSNRLRTLVNKILSLENNTLVLFDFLEIKTRLFEILKDKYHTKDVKFIDGSTLMVDREDIRSEFEESNNLVLFAQSQTFGRGINIKNVHNIVFLFTTKCASKLIQSIGRGLRVLPNKSKVNVFDVNSNLKYAHRHFLQRKKLYAEHFGITEIKNISNEIDLSCA